MKLPVVVKFLVLMAFQNSSGGQRQISSRPVRWFRKEPQNMVIVREYAPCIHIYIYMEYIPAFYHKVKPNVVCRYSSLMERVGMPEQFSPRYFYPPKKLDD